MRLVVPTSCSRAPQEASSSGIRKPSPISTNSPRLSRMSRPGASVTAARARAAAPLLTTWTSSAAGTASRRAAMAPRPRGARLPVPKSSSTSVYPPTAAIASSAARDSGARPRLVCSTTPVALCTGLRPTARAGSAARAAWTASPGPIRPSRTACWAVATAALTRGLPSRANASPSRGSPSSTVALGTCRRVSAGGCRVLSATVHPDRSQRRRTGIEPAWPGFRTTPILKIGRGTSPPNASGARF